MTQFILATILLAQIGSVAEVKQALFHPTQSDEPIDLVCTVVATNFCYEPGNRSYTIYIAEDNGAYCNFFYTNHNARACLGQRVRMTGNVSCEEYGWRRAYVNDIAILGAVPIPPADELTAHQLSDNRFFCHQAIMRGILADVFTDEIDPRFTCLTLRGEDGCFLASTDKIKLDALRQLIGAKLKLTGIANTTLMGGKRRFQKPLLAISELTVETPPPNDPFNAPSAEYLGFTTPEQLLRLNRHRMEGRVLTVWHGNRVLIKSDNGNLCSARLSMENLPQSGDRVVLVGFPSTDYFALSLSHTICKVLSHDPLDYSDPEPCLVSTKDLLSGRYSSHQLRPEYYGKLIRLTGKVIQTQRNDNGLHSFSISFGDSALTVDLSAFGSDAEPPAVESTVDVTGICVLNIDETSTSTGTLRLNGFVVVPRRPADLRITKTPPWWTMGKMLAVTIGLCIFIVAIFLWNLALRHLIERRGRQLFKAEIAKTKANLRANERTRLAADLHDTLSQNLSGLACQIAAVRSSMRYRPEATAETIDKAEQMLLASRTELRRCLWDLRSDVLDRPDFEDALREVLRQVASDASLAIDFRVSRAHLNDREAHAIISITRELTANAVNHGKAASINISGNLTDGVLEFSVEDDGVGFDTTNHPGVAEGHFGLQGIKERVLNFNGTFEIFSTPGKGSRAVVSIKISSRRKESTK